MDRLFLHQIAVPAIIGVHAHEQVNPQTLYIDLEIAINASVAAAKDDLTLSVDYAAVYHFVQDYVPNTIFVFWKP